MSKIIDKNCLICPQCQSDRLFFKKSKIRCLSCQKQYSFKNNKYYFISFKKGEINDFLDKIKFRLKKYGKFYQYLIWLISPVCPNFDSKRFIKEFIEGKNIIALNIGSGNSDYSSQISNIDILPYSNVDLTCNIEHLPFKNQSVDAIINIAVLEHIAYPEKVVQEIHRILKKKGVVFSFIPFIQGFHASPHDYSRRTPEGIKILYKDFREIELKNAGGPTSGFLWVFQEWVAILLSFGIRPFYFIIYLTIMILTFPLKFLDILLIRYSMAKNISSGFIYIGKKK